MPSADPIRPIDRAPEAPTRPRRRGNLTAWKRADTARAHGDTAARRIAAGTGLVDASGTTWATPRPRMTGHCRRSVGRRPHRVASAPLGAGRGGSGSFPGTGNYAHPALSVCAHRGYRPGAGTRDADRESRAALE
ncbi:hypothetical protein Aca07nite_25150 [Actinoplanes capillaceus]|uniref:Uncharacterized protein n=1 Tax=Actinoplanes campanulatus TaxID=113559 RepID=A0ABQ3WF99_9ACTN|nr:hypothetical protein Aca07nite_25150 [Actinoplanes capillaceus]